MYKTDLLSLAAVGFAVSSVPLLSLQGSGGLHASTSLFAALVEGGGPLGGPLREASLGLGIPPETRQAVSLLLRQCAADAMKMSGFLLLRFAVRLKTQGPL